MQTVLTDGETELLKALRVISDETRFKILKLLLSDQELCVSSIAEQLEISVSAVSQHFKLFERANLVNKNRYGQKICYILKQEAPLVKQLIDIGTI